MNHLHRSLAPISPEAWDQIQDEARRTFARNAAARRVVDVPDPAGWDYSAAGTGHVHPVEAPPHLRVRQRQVQPAVELRVPFTVTRDAVDDVERGAQDADWQPVKDAATRMALAEDGAVFHGMTAAGVGGIVESSSNAPVAWPSDVREAPTAVAQAVSALRLAGVDGPYSLLLSATLSTAVTETTDHGYPIREHIRRELPNGHIIWAPALEGALLVTERGGDFTLQLGQDLSIGYDRHDAEGVHLYLEESFTFLVNTTEASVVLR
jgi:uncharacterized linocin/CFP29 family protein